MTETDDVAQAVSHMKLTFPKKIFEVCHLMKRETEAEFFAPDVAGEFTKHIQLLRLNDDNVSICLTVDNLTFEANNLCFYVDKVKAKDDASVQTIMEQQQLLPHDSSSISPLSCDVCKSTLSAVNNVTDESSLVLPNNREKTACEDKTTMTDDGGR